MPVCITYRTITQNGMLKKILYIYMNIYIYIYIYIKVNYGNKSNSMKKIENQIQM